MGSHREKVAERFPDLTPDELDDLDISHAAELDQRVGRAIAMVTRLEAERDRWKRLAIRRMLSIDDRQAVRHAWIMAREALRAVRVKMPGDDEEGLNIAKDYPEELALADRGLTVIERILLEPREDDGRGSPS